MIGINKKDISLHTKRSVYMNDTRQHILFTAFKLFIKEGYRDITMNRLVNESGLSKGAFYHYFVSKEQLFSETVNTFFFGMFEKINIQPDDQQNLRNNLLRIIDGKDQAFKTFADYSGGDVPEVNFFMYLFQAIQYLPDMKEKMKEYLEYESQIFVRMIAHAKMKGEIKQSVDENAFARQISCMMDGVELHGVMLSDYASIFDTERQMIHFLCDLVEI